MAELTCPECGTRTELPMVRRNADEFCPHCDYPLFWAPSNVPVAAGGVNTQSTLRRLPGAGGRRRVGTRACPECGELNPLGEQHCLRCAALMDPPPPPPPPPPPEPEPEPEPEQVVLPDEPIGTRWDFYALGALGVAAVITAILVQF